MHMQFAEPTQILHEKGASVAIISKTIEHGELPVITHTISGYRCRGSG